MKRMIAVQIEPDEDGRRCGECRRAGCRWHEEKETGQRTFTKDGYAWKVTAKYRGPECYAAEVKLRALIEAGNVLRKWVANGPSLDELARGYERIKAWDAAIAALEGKP